jgi:hypothetical protein
MNKFQKILCSLLLTTSVCGVGNLAHAGMIQIETDKSTYQTGELITATLRASLFRDTLTGFFVALQYHPTQLVLQNFSFGNGFDDGFGSYRFAEAGAINGRLSMEEYADWAADLATLTAQQQGGFVLGTLQFKALGTGQFGLGLDPAYLGVITASNVLATPDWSGARFDVNAASVPAPSMLISGLLLLMFVRQRLSRQV